MLPIWFVMLATVAQQSPSIHDDTLHFTLRVPSTCRYSPDWSSVVKTPYAWACQSSRSGLVQFKVSLQALAGEVRESNFDSTLNLTRLQNPTASAIALQWRAGEIHGWSMDLLENLQVVMVAVPLEGRALQLAVTGVAGSRDEEISLAQSFLDGLEGVRSSENGMLSADQRADAMIRTIWLFAGVAVFVLVWKWWRARQGKVKPQLLTPTRFWSWRRIGILWGFVLALVGLFMYIGASSTNTDIQDVMFFLILLSTFIGASGTIVGIVSITRPRVGDWHPGKVLMLWCAAALVSYLCVGLLQALGDSNLGRAFRAVGYGFLSAALVTVAVTPWVVTWNWFSVRETRIREE